MRALNVAPLYIVPQKIPTPKQHMMVAMSVAYGTLAIQSLHMFPKQGKFVSSFICLSVVVIKFVIAHYFMIRI